MSIIVPYFDTRGGSSADYERAEVTSSFSSGLNFQDGQINHVYVNRYGRITFLDIQAETNEVLSLQQGVGLYLFKVAASEKRAIPYQNCPIIGRFIYDIDAVSKVAVCSICYDSSSRTFYLYDVTQAVQIPANGIQIQCAFINGYEG